MQHIIEEFQERADICEQEGHMTRSAAEALAMDQMCKHYGEKGVIVILDRVHA